MEDREKQIQKLINSRTSYVGHGNKVFYKINDLIENCEHYKKLDCLQDQLMSVPEKLNAYITNYLNLFSDQISTKLVRSITLMKTLE